MPEVPEIALTSQILHKYFKNDVLTKIKFVSGRWARKNPNGYEQFKDDLPLKLVRVDSKGKFMWFDFEEKKNPANHWYVWNTFGLTGMWSLSKPEHERLVMTFEGGKKAYFADMRNFGTFKFDPSSNALKAKLATLAPDFLKEDVDLSRITQYKKIIVEILMDQRKVGSGLGNYLVPEILYRAKISPYRTGSSLTPIEIKRLSYWIKYTTKQAYIDNHTCYMADLGPVIDKIKRINYHPTIDLKNNKFIFKVYRQKTDPNGNKVEAVKIINDRTTYWVPDIQH